MTLRIGIIGVSGYIGQAMATHVQAAGHHVVGIGRSEVGTWDEFRHADLRDPLRPGLVSGLDAVIHLAADTRGSSTSAATELLFATQLARDARAYGVPLLVVSSQAASPHAPSDYGRGKAAIERSVIPLGAACLRPGLVYGGASRGLYGALMNLVRKYPAVPAFFPSPKVQPIHVQDLARILLLAVTTHHEPGRIWNAAGPPVTFADFLLSLAKFRLRVWRPRFPVPVALMRGLLSITGPLLGEQFSLGRFDSLLRLPALSSEADLQELGVKLRPLADGLGRNGRPERRLLLEGRALMQAFLGHAPDRFATRRYAHAIRVIGDGRALAWPGVSPRLLGMVASIDTPAFRRNSRAGSLAWRYNIAIRVAETRIQCASAFVRTKRDAASFAFLADLLRSGTRELRARLLAPLARRHLTRAS